jgi:hypothetical protein
MTVRYLCSIALRAAMARRWCPSGHQGLCGSSINEKRSDLYLLGLGCSPVMASWWEGLLESRQSRVGAGRGLIGLGRALHAQGFARTFLVVDFDKVIEPGLLLKEVCSGGLGGCGLRWHKALIETIAVSPCALSSFGNYSILNNLGSGA